MSDDSQPKTRSKRITIRMTPYVQHCLETVRHHGLPAGAPPKQHAPSIVESIVQYATLIRAEVASDPRPLAGRPPISPKVPLPRVPG